MRSLAESLKRIREVLNVDTVAILLLETEGDELVAWAAHGLEEEVELGVRIPVARVLRERLSLRAKPIIIPDVSNADLYNPLLREKGIKSLLGVPLFSKAGRSEFFMSASSSMATSQPKTYGCSNWLPIESPWRLKMRAFIS